MYAHRDITSKYQSLVSLLLWVAVIPWGWRGLGCVAKGNATALYGGSDAT